VKIGGGIGKIDRESERERDGRWKYLGMRRKRNKTTMENNAK
jgi:hypothetical protein